MLFGKNNKYAVFIRLQTCGYSSCLHYIICHWQDDAGGVQCDYIAAQRASIYIAAFRIAILYEIWRLGVMVCKESNKACLMF